MLHHYKKLLFCFAALFTFTLSAQDYKSLIENYLQTNGLSHGLNPSLIDFEINSATTLGNKTSKVVYISQAYNGIKIAETSATVIINDNAVDYFNHTFIPNIAPLVQRSSTGLSKTNAINQAVTQLGLQGQERIYVSDYSSGEDILVENADDNISIPLYLQKVESNYVSAYEMIIKEPEHWWTVKIDATSGEMLDKKDLVISCNFSHDLVTDKAITHESHSHTVTKNGKSFLEPAVSRDINRTVSAKPATTASLTSDGAIYRAFPLRIESPLHGPGTGLAQDASDKRVLLVDPSAVPANSNGVVPSPFGWHDLDGAPGNETTNTTGNNVSAYLDVFENDSPSAPEGQEPIFDAGPSLFFDAPLDLDLQPTGYYDAAIINLFVWNNFVHDVWYNYGFDETSGNFQESTYDREVDDNNLLFGYNGDSVNAEAQDQSQTEDRATNNANMATSFDGSNPRMQMYLWGASPFGNFTEVFAPSELAGLRNSSRFPFHPLPGPDDAEVRSDLVVVQDDMTPYTGEDGGTPGLSTEPDDGCTDYVNGDDVVGKVVLVRRGVCAFATKIRRAFEAGAIGVIMVNNDEANPDAVIAGGGTPDGPIEIPAVMVSFNDGDALINAVNAGTTVNARIFTQTPGGIEKDGDLDNGIIVHEYGHGISTRLTGGRTEFTCITSVMEVNGEQMGEGWSDWFALVMTQELDDVATQPRGIGTYVLGQDIDGAGIRPSRYSTDMGDPDVKRDGINDYTYDEIDNAEVSTPHGVGFVWSTILWDMYWALIDKHGFDADMYNGTGGNNIAMQLVIDGLKIQNCRNVGFVEGRNAILTADEMLFGTDPTQNNECLIRAAFARRGVGALAVQGSTNRNDEVEDFTVSDPLGTNCDAVLGTTDLNKTIFSVYPNPTSGQVFINTNKNFGMANVALYDINGRKVLERRIDMTNTGTLDTSSVSAGVYILKIDMDDASTHSQKLIVR